MLNFCIVRSIAIVFSFICIQGHLRLDPGVVIHQADSVVIAQKNSPLLIDCSATSSSDAGHATYKWHKNGKPVVTDKFLQTLSNGSLFFPLVKNNFKSKNRNKNHNGFYECFLKNKYGTVIARQVRLNVARMSTSFSVEPKDQDVNLGGVARFECRIEGIPPPIYVWKKDYSYLPGESRFVDLHSGILQIHNVTESDAGSYHCSAFQSLKKETNVCGNTNQIFRSKQAKLNVFKDANRRPPLIIASETQVNVLNNTSVSLECLVDGNPPPFVIWQKDNRNIVDSQYKKIFGGSNLRFIKVDKKIDAGNYACVASSLGFPVAKAVTKLNVQVPPFMITAPVSLTEPVARRLRLHCEVGGTPKPKVTWYKNGEKIIPNGRLQIRQNNDLVIDSGVSDSGYYQCLAKNDVGVVMATARLLISLKDKAPKSPENLTITKVTDRSICLEWSKSSYPPCCAVLAYTVHHQALTDVKSLYTKDVTLETKACIYDLKPFTDYDIFVRPYSTYGAGTQSETVTVKTWESVPDKTPTVTVSSFSPTTIDIEWDKIPTEKSNGILTRYQVFISTGDQITIEDITGAYNSYTATGLQPDSEYKIRIRACTAVGCSNVSDDEWPWKSQRTEKLNQKANGFLDGLGLNCTKDWNGIKLNLMNSATTVDLDKTSNDTEEMVVGLVNNLFCKFELYLEKKLTEKLSTIQNEVQKRDSYMAKRVGSLITYSRNLKKQLDDCVRQTRALKQDLSNITILVQSIDSRCNKHFRRKKLYTGS